MRNLLLAIVCLALPSAVSAQSLTEADALHLGLARTDLQDLEQGTRAVAEADVYATGVWANPTLDYSRERMRGPLGATDQTWQIAQSFDLSGRRGLRQDAAARRLDAAEAGNSARRAERAAEIRRRFHEVLFGQKTTEATAAWVRRFAHVEAIVEKRVRAGEASGYDRRRLARDRQAAESRLATEQAALERSRERLAALLGQPGRMSGAVAGVLLPEALPALEASLAMLDRRPDLQALARRAEAATLEGRAAARGWIPDIRLGVGTKQSDNGISRENGAILTLSVPLPVFDRQQAGERRAAAEALNARAEYSLARSRAEGELRGLTRQMERLMAAAADYRAQAVAASPELLRIAEAAYQGGESNLLELLDAYRGALEAETTALELEWKTREARIDYDLLTGSTTE